MKIALTVVIILLSGQVAAAPVTADNCRLRDIPAGESDDFALVFQSIIDSVYCNKFDGIPDDAYLRTYLASVYRGIYLECADSHFEMPTVVPIYAVPQFRQMFTEPGKALEELFGTLERYAEELQDPSRLLPLLETRHENGPYLSIGIEDGKMIAVELGCQTVTVRVLKQRLLALFNERAYREPISLPPDSIISLMHREWRDVLGDKLPH